MRPFHFGSVKSKIESGQLGLLRRARSSRRSTRERPDVPTQAPSGAWKRSSTSPSVAAGSGCEQTLGGHGAQRARVLGEEDVGGATCRPPRRSSRRARRSRRSGPRRSTPDSRLELLEERADELLVAAGVDGQLVVGAAAAPRRRQPQAASDQQRSAEARSRAIRGMGQVVSEDGDGTVVQRRRARARRARRSRWRAAGTTASSAVGETHAVEHVVAAELAADDLAVAVGGDGEAGRARAAATTSRRRRLPSRPRRLAAARAEDVGGADELGRPAVDGLVVETLGSVDLDDAPVAHQRDAVGERERLLLVVGDEQDGRAGGAQDARELLAHRAAQHGIDRSSTARRAGRSAARAPAREPARRAAAGRR